ncbi:MAG TPA: hypothetical protein VFA83_14560 [Acidimicrobiales bacterium]|nr:hypothetical protein [Acidimicrobiales bacterium]
MTASDARRCREPAAIEANLATYLGDRSPTARYASFDYCYNYFQSYRERDDVIGIAAPQNLQLSCLQLGFYLASWGMLRGSTDLLQRSVKHLVPLVEAIAHASAPMWEVDADSYSDDTWLILSDFGRQIRRALPDATSDILVTKVMLGVFGNVPAFDTNFRKGSGLSTYGHGALRRVERFYREHSEVIDRHRVPTLDFATGAETHRTYSRAKVIDMIFFIEGAPASRAS